MKFEVTIECGNQRWVEHYSMLSVRSIDDAVAWSSTTVDAFNVARDDHRRVVDVALTGLDPVPPHAWRKQNLVTERDNFGFFDRYACERCGAEGRAYGIGAYVKLWGKWRKPKYIHCMPEEAPPKQQESEVKMDEAAPPALATKETPWYTTASDGPPVRVGVYRTTADPTRADTLKPIYRYYAGESRWGPTAHTPRIALTLALIDERNLTHTSPLMWRGLDGDSQVAAHVTARAVLNELGARPRVPLLTDADKGGHVQQQQELALETPVLRRPRVQLKTD